MNAGLALLLQDLYFHHNVLCYTRMYDRANCRCCGVKFSRELGEIVRTEFDRRGIRIDSVWARDGGTQRYIFNRMYIGISNRVYPTDRYVSVSTRCGTVSIKDKGYISGGVRRALAVVDGLRRDVNALQVPLVGWRVSLYMHCFMYS